MGMTSRSRRILSREVSIYFRPSVNKGRGEYRALDVSAAAYAKKIKHTSIVTTVTPEKPGIPRALCLQRAENKWTPRARVCGETAKSCPSVIACDKREAFARGSEATKQSIFALSRDGLLRGVCHRARVARPGGSQ